MVRATSQIDDYTENNETGDRDDLDGPIIISGHGIGMLGPVRTQIQIPPRRKHQRRAY
jgi:hypothetical protein